MWVSIGKDAYMLQHPQGFIHVMKLGRDVWSVTLNGRVKGQASTEAEAKQLAEGM